MRLLFRLWKILTLCAILLIILLESVSSEDEYHCVMYGECNLDYFGRSQNCLYTGPAISLDRSGQKLLRKRCPHFYNNDKVTSSIKTCCDTKQLNSLDQNIQLVEQFLHYCPSCLQNLLTHFCDFTCAVDQSRFMNVTEIEEDGDREYATAITLYLSDEYMSSTFNSCRKVSVHSTGQLALDLMCGEWGESRCSARKWFSFMGDAGRNVYTPFQITYVPTDVSVDVFIPLNPQIKYYNKTIYYEEPACSCLDCDACCAVHSKEPALPESFRVIGLNGYIFITSLVFCVIVSSVFILIVYSYSGTSTVKEEDVNQRSQRIVNSAREEDGPSSVDTTRQSDQTGSILEQIASRTVRILQDLFQQWGMYCALNPWRVLLCVSCVVVALGYGITHINISSDPLESWILPTSRSRTERQLFEQNFEPSYRTEQVIISAVGLDNIRHETSDGTIEFGPVFHKHFLMRVLNLKHEIESLGRNESNSLETICITHLKGTLSRLSKISQCVVQSIWSYFQDNEELQNTTDIDSNNFEVNYLDHLKRCFHNPYNPECLPLYGISVDPAFVLGGFIQSGDSLEDIPKYEKATAVILTFLVNNSHNKTDLLQALEWEKRFVTFMKDWIETKKPDYMEIAFTAERSFEDEIDLGSNFDVNIIVVCYIIMFAFIVISLGKLRVSGRLLIGSKLSVAVGGVLIVVASVVGSCGLLGFIGIPVNMTIIKLLPFLTLAMGVDNIFILVHTHRSEVRRENETQAEHIGRTLGQVGPCILLNGLSQSGGLFLASFSDMLVVKAFAMYAGMALLINVLLHLTCFVSLFALDILRQDSNRFDVCCFVRGSQHDSYIQPKRIRYKFYKDLYAPFLMNRHIRAATMVVFCVWLCSSIAVIPSIDTGIRKEHLIHEDSYIVKYFQYAKSYLSIGPPVYFVVKGDLNFSNTGIQNMICGGRYCNIDSLVRQIHHTSKQPETSYVARPASSWIDDYFYWSQCHDCCKYFPHNGSACGNENYRCSKCDIGLNKTTNRPNVTPFNKYLPFFLQDNPTESCAKAGHGAYGKAISYKTNNEGILVNVEASHFKTYHTNLKTTADHCQALKAVRTISDNIKNTMNTRLNQLNISKSVEVFPYSNFYAFHEQYLTMWSETLYRLGISLVAVFLLSFFLTGLDVLSAFVVTINVAMIVTNIGGLMFWSNISLNALSLVNLVASVGISTGFCSHLVHCFTMSAEPTRVIRVKDVLVNMRSSIYSGSTLTKICGVLVLVLVKSCYFQLYCFRMYLCIILCGVVHGLMFLPVFLSYIGPPRNKQKLNRYKPCSEEEENTILPQLASNPPNSIPLTASYDVQ